MPAQPKVTTAACVLWMNISGYRKFRELRKVASVWLLQKMATNLFSTPSQPDAQCLSFLVRCAVQPAGAASRQRWTSRPVPRRIWPPACCAQTSNRQIVTVEDAVRGGCNIFDAPTGAHGYGGRIPEHFDVRFVGRLRPCFPLSELQACMVDSTGSLDRLSCSGPAPVGWREVWIGYDPAKGTQNGDSAGCVVVAPPKLRARAVSFAFLEGVTSGAGWTSARS